MSREFQVEPGGRAPDPQIEAAVWTRELSKRFDDESAVEDVTFHVPRGSIFGFIGPSGCGKTTTVRMLTGVYEPTSGEVSVLGHHPKRFSPKLRARIGYMPQQFVLYPDLTVWENLNFSASIYGVARGRRERFDELLEFVELSNDRRKLVRKTSGGMQRRLSLAATLVHDPELLFLDEPTAGIDPVLRRRIWDHFQALQTEGKTLFVTTQYVGEASYCDLVGVMSDGRLLFVDTPDGLRKRAFGGSQIDLRLGQRVTRELLGELESLPIVLAQPLYRGPNDLRLTVSNAATAIPDIMEYCQAQTIEVESIQEYVPPFDDVFVELVKREPIHG